MTLLAAMIAACSSEDNVIEAGQPALAEGIPFTATISTGGASTRTTLTEAKDGSDKDIFTVVWNVNDEVELIYQVSGVTKTATAQVVAVDNTTGVATISATLDANTEDGTAVTLRYPASSLDPTTHDFDPAKLKAQTGTLAGLGAYDWREGTGTLSGTGATATLSSNVKMESKVAIWKVSPKDGGSAISTKILNIKNDAGDVLAGTAVSMPASTSVYLALQPIASQKVFIEACSSGADGYDYSKEGVTLNENTYYQSDVAMTSDPSSRIVPLTLEATANGNIMVYPKITMSYSEDGGALVEISANTTINVNAGQKVSFYSTNSALAKLESSILGCTYFRPNIPCYVYGNVMSLIDDSGNGFANDKTISAEIALTGLFNSNMGGNVINHPTKPILLPATTLANRCYEDMFSGCTGLTTAPDLPATELKSECYKTMFYGCTGLTKAPDLPATTLANNCYMYMFFGCTNLTTAPDLPAPTLVFGCYDHMFSGCNSLNYVKCLATNVSAQYCLDNWLDGVSATGTFVKASSGADWAVAGSNGIPSGWTVQTE